MPWLYTVSPETGNHSNQEIKRKIGSCHLLCCMVKKRDEPLNRSKPNVKKDLSHHINRPYHSAKGIEKKKGINWKHISYLPYQILYHTLNWSSFFGTQKKERLKIKMATPKKNISFSSKNFDHTYLVLKIDLLPNCWLKNLKNLQKKIHNMCYPTYLWT